MKSVGKGPRDRRPEPWSLLVRGGTLVLPGSGTVRADVAVRDRRIVAIGTELTGPADRTVDAAGLHVFPGLVDPHVHFGILGDWSEECRIETGAALLGGVTTVGCYLRSVESYLPTLEAAAETIAGAAFTDVFLHLALFTPDQLAELPRYHTLGVSSFKLYLAGIPGVVPHSDERFVADAFAAIERLGAGCVACVHAENAALVEGGMRRAARRSPRPGWELRLWDAARPEGAEELAAWTAAQLARDAPVELYVVHVTSATTAATLAPFRAGPRANPPVAPVYLEATSAHLGLDWDEPNGLLAKLVPPVRHGQNRDALWRAVADGSIATVGTDNTARTRATKRPEAGVLGAAPGYHGLGTHLAVLLDEGFHRRGIPLHVLAERACAAPARIFGLPRKGTIGVGADADLVLVDLQETRTVNPAALGSLADFSPFEGRRLRGWPVLTVKGGRIVAEGGRLTENRPSGRYLARASRVSRRERMQTWTRRWDQ